jgi:hypothetical protein
LLPFFGFWFEICSEKFNFVAKTKYPEKLPRKLLENFVKELIAKIHLKNRVGPKLETLLSLTIFTLIGRDHYQHYSQRVPPKTILQNGRKFALPHRQLLPLDPFQFLLPNQPNHPPKGGQAFVDKIGFIPDLNRMIRVYSHSSPNRIPLCPCHIDDIQLPYILPIPNLDPINSMAPTRHSIKASLIDFFPLRDLVH